MRSAAGRRSGSTSQRAGRLRDTDRGCGRAGVDRDERRRRQGDEGGECEDDGDHYADMRGLPRAIAPPRRLSVQMVPATLTGLHRSSLGAAACPKVENQLTPSYCPTWLTHRIGRCVANREYPVRARCPGGRPIRESQTQPPRPQRVQADLIRSPCQTTTGLRRSEAGVFRRFRAQRCSERRRSAPSGGRSNGGGARPTSVRRASLDAVRFSVTRVDRSRRRGNGRRNGRTRPS